MSFSFVSNRPFSEWLNGTWAEWMLDAHAMNPPTGQPWSWRVLQDEEADLEALEETARSKNKGDCGAD